MKEVIQKVAQSLLVLPALVLGLSFALPIQVGAAECNTVDIGTGVGGGADCVAPTTAQRGLFGPDGIFVVVTNILIFIIGAIAVIMLIIGGVRYTISQGDQNAITSAKNTILYAIIGIVVAVLAYGAVSFITSQLTKTT